MANRSPLLIWGVDDLEILRQIELFHKVVNFLSSDDEWYVPDAGKKKKIFKWLRTWKGEHEFKRKIQIPLPNYFWLISTGWVV